jgi:copper transporter 1
MLWNWYTIDACFISTSWHVTTTGGFAASCIGAMLMVVLLEGLRRMSREYDDWILRDFQSRIRSVEYTTLSAHGSGERAASTSNSMVFRATPIQQLIRAILHAATFGLAYLIMLLAMYYNGYIIICIFIGAGLGKFLCDWMQKTVTLGSASVIKAENGGQAVDEPTVCCG